MAAFARWMHSCILLSFGAWACGGRVEPNLGSNASDAAAGAAATGGTTSTVAARCDGVPHRTEAPIQVAERPASIRASPARWSSSSALIAGAGQHVIYCGITGSRLASGGGCDDLGVPSEPLIPPVSPFDWADGWSAWGSAADDFYFAQWGKIYHYDGRSWSELEGLKNRFYSVTGSRPNELWLTTAGYDNYHFVAGTLTHVPSLPSASVRNLRAGGPGEVWGIRVDSAGSPPPRGPRELVRYVEGTHWIGTGLVDIQSLSVTSATNAWAIAGHSIYRFDGQCWSEFEDPALTVQVSTAPLSRVWASSPDNVWLTGGDAWLRHWNGQSWTLTSLDTQHPLSDIWETSAGLWVLEDSQAGGDTFYFVPRTG